MVGLCGDDFLDGVVVVVFGGGGEGWLVWFLFCSGVCLLVLGFFLVSVAFNVLFWGGFFWARLVS